MHVCYLYVSVCVCNFFLIDRVLQNKADGTTALRRSLTIFVFPSSKTLDYVFGRSGPVHNHPDHSGGQRCRAFGDGGNHTDPCYDHGCSGHHKRSRHRSQKGEGCTYYFTQRLSTRCDWVAYGVSLC